MVTAGANYSVYRQPRQPRPLSCLLAAIGRSRREWGLSSHSEQEFRDVSIQLWETGRLHQPRKFGWNPGRRPEFWLEAVLPPSELERNPAARDAWDRFQVIAGLSNIQVDREYH